MIDCEDSGSDDSVPRTGIALPDQVAWYLRSYPNRLARMRSEGKGPAYIKLGKSVRYRWEDVHRFVEANLQNTAEEAQE
jgi:hypothetical protein